MREKRPDTGVTKLKWMWNTLCEKRPNTGVTKLKCIWNTLPEKCPNTGVTKLKCIWNTLREKCSNMEFFWSVFSCIWTEYGKIRARKSSMFGHFSRSDKYEINK